MVNREEFEDVLEELEDGSPLSIEQVGRVFGEDFWMLLVYCLLDAQEAARAIQGAINRLRGAPDVPEEPRH